VIFWLCRAGQIGFSPIRESTVLPIVRAVDEKVTFRVVTASSPGRLSDDEKLEVLRRLDQFRHWHSLDEERYCLVCGNLITGRQIHVAGGTRANGPLRLNCPTQACNSIPMDWVLPTNEILAKVEKLAAEERRASVSKLAEVANGNGKIVQPGNQQHNFVSRLLRLAFPFKRYS
jgi:hypothetical protein